MMSWEPKSLQKHALIFVWSFKKRLRVCLWKWLFMLCYPQAVHDEEIIGSIHVQSKLYVAVQFILKQIERITLSCFWK